MFLFIYISKKGISNRFILLLSFFFSLALTLLHLKFIDWPRIDAQMEWHNNIINNQGPYPDQYRILTYYLAQGLISLGLPFSYAFALLRLVFTTFSFFVFFKYLEHWCNPLTSLLGFFMLASTLPFTYLFYTMQPSDPLNMLLYFLAFLTLAKEKDAWLIPILIIGMFNRETIILIPIIYLLARYKEVPFKTWFPFFSLLSIISLGIFIDLKLYFGIKEPYAPVSPLHYWTINLTDWKTWIQLVGFFHITLLIFWRNWSLMPAFLKRLTYIIPLFFAIHFSVGNIREVRYFLPILAILIPMTLLNFEIKYKIPNDKLISTVRKLGKEGA
jgi:hypothetical protein